MMRTIEALISVLIITGGIIAAFQMAVMPSPSTSSASQLQQLALSTLQVLDAQGYLTQTAFSPFNSPSWLALQSALASQLPSNILYNLTVFNVVTGLGGQILYQPANSLSNSPSLLGVGSRSASLLVTSPNVTYTVTPQKIPRTLYILNASDANGWWITGYTAQSLASDLANLLSPFFQRTITVNTTFQLGTILNGTSLLGESVQQAIVIDTFGESVPIPAGYYTSTGYDSAHSSYAKYTYNVGRRVNQYNWTWVSIVGYPLYYVSNTATFASSQNSWGIYGMVLVGPAGLNAFLQGIDNQPYSYNNNWITGSPGVVSFTSSALYYQNYYGVYPAPSQTSTRAIPTSILSQYHLSISSSRGYVFNPVSNWLAGSTYTHKNGPSITGIFTAIGLTRIPDIKVTELAILMFYQPVLFKSQFTASGTSKLVVLELAYQGAS